MIIPIAIVLLVVVYQWNKSRNRSIAFTSREDMEQWLSAEERLHRIQDVDWGSLTVTYI